MRQRSERGTSRGKSLMKRRTNNAAFGGRSPGVYLILKVMKIKIFAIPIVGGEEDNSLMNNFLSSHRVIDVQQQIVADKYWTFCVRYVDKVSADANVNNGKKEKIDFRKVLDENTFAKFSAIRARRKETAAEKALPAFAIFTDAELAEISKLDNPCISTIAAISGIGDKRAEEYAPAIMEVLIGITNKMDETPL